MLRVRPIRQILLVLLAVSVALSINQATLASEAMSLEMAKASVVTADMSAAQCEANLPKPCAGKAINCMLMCAAPTLGMPVVVTFDYAPLPHRAHSASVLPSPMGMTRLPNLPPPRTTDI